jgi:hypothetical protein
MALLYPLLSAKHRTGYVKQLIEVILTSVKNIVEICKQITILVLYLVSYRLLGDINTEAWSSGIGVGSGANNPTL